MTLRCYLDYPPTKKVSPVRESAVVRSGGPPISLELLQFLLGARCSGANSSSAQPEYSGRTDGLIHRLIRYRSYPTKYCPSPHQISIALVRCRSKVPFLGPSQTLLDPSIRVLELHPTDKTFPLIPEPPPCTSLVSHMQTLRHHHPFILLLELNKADRTLNHTYAE